MRKTPPNILTSGAAFSDLTAGGLSNVLELLITANSSNTAAPTSAPTVVANGGGTFGGALAPGTYYCEHTETNGVGETTASPESAQFTVSRQSNPSTQATVAVTGGGTTGGSLAAGTYFVAYTFVDSVNAGETTVGTSESTQFTVASGNKPRVTLPALPSFAASINIYLTAAGGASGSEVLYATGVTGTTYDLVAANGGSVTPPAANTTSTVIPQVTFPALKTNNTARNLYLTAANGASGSEVLYVAGVTTTTVNLSTAALSGNTAADLSAPPTTNTTGLQANQISRIRSAKVTGQLEYQYMHAAQAIRRFVEGGADPTLNDINSLNNSSVVFHALAQACDDCAALMWANPGHFQQLKNPIGDYVTKRTQP